MKTLLSILFFAAFLWQPVYQSGYIAYWQINKERIAKTECINRFRPMMHCEGKCQLYLELKKAADEEAENNKLPTAVLKLKTLDTFIEIENNWQPLVIVISSQKLIFSNYSSPPMNGYLNTLLRPPQKLA